MTTVNFNIDQNHIYEYFPASAVASWTAFRNYSGSISSSSESAGYFTRVESSSGYRAMTRSFMRFTISGIPTGAVITSAKLHWYQASSNFTFVNGTPSISVGFYNRAELNPTTDYYNCMPILCTTHARGDRKSVV